MEKDLALSALNYHFKGNSADSLIEELTSFLSQQSENSILNLCYRVDIPPNDVAMENKADLSIQLWDRVCKKVWIRLHL